MVPRLSLVAIALIAAGCAGPAVHFDVPVNHPAHRDAPAGAPPATSSTLDLASAESVSTQGPVADMPVSPGMAEHLARSPSAHDHAAHGSGGHDAHAGHAGHGHSAPGAQSQAGEAATVYACPIHTTVTAQQPGQCPVCRTLLVEQVPQGGEK